MSTRIAKGLCGQHNDILLTWDLGGFIHVTFKLNMNCLLGKGGYVFSSIGLFVCVYVSVCLSDSNII